MRDSPAKSQAWLDLQVEKAVHMAPCILVLDYLDVISNKSAQQHSSQINVGIEKLIASIDGQVTTNNFPLILVATARDLEQVDDIVQAKFHHQIAMDSPNEEERLGILRHASRKLCISPEISLKDISLHTASFVAQDLTVLMSLACESAMRRARGHMHVFILFGI
jgi:peroxin-6